MLAAHPSGILLILPGASINRQAQRLMMTSSAETVITLYPAFTCAAEPYVGPRQSNPADRLRIVTMTPGTRPGSEEEKHMEPQHLSRRMVLLIAPALVICWIASLIVAPKVAASGKGPVKEWYAGAFQSFVGHGVRANLTQHALANMSPSESPLAAAGFTLITVTSANALYGVAGGWGSDPGFFGWPGNQPRLYVGTFNATTGGRCDNTSGDITCGWVQVAATPQPGSALAATNTPQAYEITHFAGLDGGRWWVKYQDTWIGYFPAAILSSSFMEFDQAAWKGWVITSLNTDPPCADMGSGLYATWDGAAQITGMELLDRNGVWHAATPTLSAPDPQYYSVKQLTWNGFPRNAIAYGGPGSIRGSC
jgi:hypothetical protein